MRTVTGSLLDMFKMKLLKNNWIIIGIILIVLIIVKTCEQDPKVVTKTKVIYKTKTDTIHTVEIKEVPKTVIVEKIKTIKGKDSIIYVDRQTDTSIEANQYDTELKANNALAKLKITTTGQLLDVSGTIQWNEKETQTTTTITKPKSGPIPLRSNIGKTFIRSIIYWN